ncbi:integrase [Dysgonomonas sp. PH5-45]|uniref:phage integrase SAM-like domain-containing protein n=1 Tax=unclassified Dysgonomonas TaxID=2630389 RepID=UPI0024746405|nr:MULTISPECIES: phage integrase SAM-like domain-containing protein [unclassified Dysgonomonas]MDH6354748.1 integrase [Dysgonomonas sp. PH5-45]MDH6387647.1 integrase [Dysgonomonas sp. PH5-37]
MATLRLIIDKQHPNSKNKVPIKLEFGAKSKKSQISLDVYVDAENWDSKEMIILPTKPKSKKKNVLIQNEFSRAEEFIEKLKLKGKFLDNAKYLRDQFIQSDKEPILFSEYFRVFIGLKTGRTADIYRATLNKIEKHFGSDIRFTDVDYAWLDKLDKIMQTERTLNTKGEIIKSGLEVNARAIHFRNIRSVFNYAIDNNIIGLEIYPFRRFKIKREETIKRAIKIKDLILLFNYKGSKQENWAVDISKMIFYAIGINIKDLYHLNDFSGTYLNYKRAKTNKLYTIFIEPELKVLLNKYASERTLMFTTQFKMYNSFGKKLNAYLAIICTKINIPKITTYSLRHTWATLAAELEVPKETIAAALGHGGNTITDVYIKFNQNKINEANRKVITYIENTKIKYNAISLILECLIRNKEDAQ